MPCPTQIANPVGNYGDQKYTAGDKFGWRVHPVTGERKFHYGIDIPAPSGESIRSILNGTVTSSRTSDSYGNVVQIRHDNGMESTYAHMLIRHVIKGDRVRAGDIIGNVGMTGTATGNHLHLELTSADGKLFDPADCYQASQHISPYAIPQPLDPDVEDDKTKWWPWVVGGGILVGGTILYFVLKDDKKKPKRKTKTA